VNVVYQTDIVCTCISFTTPIWFNSHVANIKLEHYLVNWLILLVKSFSHWSQSFWRMFLSSYSWTFNRIERYFRNVMFTTKELYPSKYG